MNKLSNFINEDKDSAHVIYVVYFSDGTMYNYFTDEKEANKVKDQLNIENPDNKCYIKQEAQDNIIESIID